MIATDSIYKAGFGRLVETNKRLTVALVEMLKQQRTGDWGASRRSRGTIANSLTSPSRGHYNGYRSAVTEHVKFSLYFATVFLPNVFGCAVRPTLLERCLVSESLSKSDEHIP